MRTIIILPCPVFVNDNGDEKVFENLIISHAENFSKNFQKPLDFFTLVFYNILCEFVVAA